MNPAVDIIRMIKTGANPQQIMLQYLEGQSNTPMGANLLNLARQNNTAEIEKKLRKEKFDDVKVYFVRHYSQDCKKELPEKIREIVREIEQDL